MIRPKSLGLFFRDNKILVFEAVDKVKNETFYRPLGGSIEFGEHSKDALIREIREEINTEIKNIQLWGVLESMFEYEDVEGHEIVFIYGADLVDEKMYYQQEIYAYEDNGDVIPCYWKSVDWFQDGNGILYPDGLLDLINVFR